MADLNMVPPLPAILSDSVPLGVAFLFFLHVQVDGSLLLVLLEVLKPDSPPGE